jgi:hypothetical protein
MDTTSLVICSRTKECENKKCEHHDIHEISEVVCTPVHKKTGKSICFFETLCSCDRGGRFAKCYPVKSTWEV